MLFGVLPVQSNPTQNELKAEVKVEIKMKYLLHLPKGYNDTEEKWPLILFLHGAGERGDNLKKVSIHGVPKMVNGGMDLPCIVVSPQCGKHAWWTSPTEQAGLMALLEEIEKKHRVDKNRIYLTGLSMGGFGTWKLAASHPEKFAAIAPICGGGDPATAVNLKNMPMWVFHGARDSVVPESFSAKMIEAVKKAGGKPKYTVYPKAGHDSWSKTYSNPEFYKWMLAQKKEKEEKAQN